MKRIAIIGSGQAGLLTAHALLQRGYDVTVYSDRTAQQWLNESRPTGTAARFAPSLDFERELGLNMWEDEAPKFDGLCFSFCTQESVPFKPFINMVGRLHGDAAAIDLRLQSACWLDEVVKRGGKVVIEKVDVPRLDEISAENDLTIVAVGRGSLAELFERNIERSAIHEPQRNLAMVIVKNAGVFDNIPFEAVKYYVHVPFGEAIFNPYYHKTLGYTWNLTFEAKPGTPLDHFMGIKSGEEMVAVTKDVIREIFPWDYHWIKDAELADSNGWLTGRIMPTVREAVGRLPSGRIVTGVGDALMALDPIGGQGANNGNRMVKHLVNAITQRGDAAFDADWMTDTFESFYLGSGKTTYDFNHLLLGDITDAGKEIFIAQYGSDGQRTNMSGQQLLANAFCNNFADPCYISHLFTDLDGMRQFISNKIDRSWRQPAMTGRIAIMRDQLRLLVGMKPAVGYW